MYWGGMGRVWEEHVGEGWGGVCWGGMGWRTEGLCSNVGEEWAGKTGNDACEDESIVTQDPLLFCLKEETAEEIAKEDTEMQYL